MVHGKLIICRKKADALRQTILTGNTDNGLADRKEGIEI
jgi:hypothetical protein